MVDFLLKLAIEVEWGVIELLLDIDHLPLVIRFIGHRSA
jgi:hypothetical protein